MFAIHTCTSVLESIIIPFFSFSLFIHVPRFAMFATYARSYLAATEKPSTTPEDQELKPVTV